MSRVLRLLLGVSVAVVGLFGSVPAAHATFAQLTFDDSAVASYRLDNDGAEENDQITLTIADVPGAGTRAVVSNTAGITDATEPADRCEALSDHVQHCAVGGTTDDEASWTFTPAEGDNSIVVQRASAVSSPTVRLIDVVRFLGGPGCDDADASAVDEVAFGFTVEPGGAPAACTQDISTPPTDGVHTITLAPSAGRNVVTGGPGKGDTLILSGFPEPGVEVSEDGLANDGERTDADDNYGRNIDQYVLSAFGDGWAGDGTVQAGEGADHLDAGAYGSSDLSGQGGDDVLVGSPFDDSLDGGDGDDALDGGFGDDRLDPGDGNDTSRAGPGDDILIDTRGADLLDGGEGSLDAIAYGAYLPAGPLTLTLDDVANDGRSGEGDNLVSMESLSGGPQADAISGDAGINYLHGGDGDDQIDGGLGVDVLRGNHGDDTITGRDSQLQPDDMGCNEGADRAVADAGDSIASDCEILDRAPAPFRIDAGTLSSSGAGPADQSAPAITLRGVPSRLTKGSLRRRGVTISIEVSEPAALELRLLGKPSRASIAAVGDLVLGETLVGRGTGVRRVRVRARPALLGRGARFKVRIEVVAIDTSGNRRTVRRTIRVAPKR